jgi:hypothetical protein
MNRMFSSPVLTFFLLLLALPGHQGSAQSVTLSSGIGWRYRDCGGGCVRTTRDAGPTVAIQAGLPVVGSLELAIEGRLWAHESERFYILTPMLKWSPSGLRMLELSGGVGVGFRRVRYLCPLPAPDDCGENRYQRSWAGTVSGGVIAPVDWPLRPIARLSYNRTLGPLGSQPPGRSDVSLMGLSLGFTTATRR